jgi:hypothetical protein
MDKEHSMKALLMYPEFPAGCSFNCEFYYLTLLCGDGTIFLLLQDAA